MDASSKKFLTDIVTYASVLEDSGAPRFEQAVVDA